jgi:hypothetical protein
VSAIIASTGEAAARKFYRRRSNNVIRKIFRERFQAFEAAYVEHYAATCCKYRLHLIQPAVQTFRLYGDWKQGIARIHCADCGYDLFVPFSCKSFFLCPSCSQKRTLHLGEYLSKDLLLSLPHRQFVWTIPRCLRVFLKHDRARESLSQYIVRAPLSMEKIVWERKTDTVVWKSPVKGQHKGKERSFTGLDFIAQLTLHIPSKGTHLVRRYGVYFRKTYHLWWWVFRPTRTSMGCSPDIPPALLVACRFIKKQGHLEKTQGSQLKSD